MNHHMSKAVALAIHKTKQGLSYDKGHGGIVYNKLCNGDRRK